MRERSARDAGGAAGIACSWLRGAAAAGALLSGAAAASEPALYLDLYGLSYHTDRAGVRREHLDNEWNPGAGLKWEFRSDARGVAFVQAGAYYDSGRHWAKVAGPGYQLKLGEHWRPGVALLLFHSATYHSGRAFVAPIPMLTYDFGGAQLSAAYAPRFETYNRFAVFGFYLSIPFSGGKR